jgi:hypothetical protein
LKSLLELDLDSADIPEEDKEVLWSLLMAPGQGKTITNLCEYLLMTQAMKDQIKVNSSPSKKM